MDAPALGWVRLHFKDNERDMCLGFWRLDGLPGDDDGQD